MSSALRFVSEGFRNRRTRPLHLIQVARSEDLRASGAELSALAQRANGAMKLHLVLTQTEGAPAGAIQGPLTLDPLKTLLPDPEGEVLLCCAVPAAGGDELIELDLQDHAGRAAERAACAPPVCSCSLGACGPPVH